MGDKPRSVRPVIGPFSGQSFRASCSGGHRGELPHASSRFPLHRHVLLTGPDICRPADPGTHKSASRMCACHIACTHAARTHLNTRPQHRAAAPLTPCWRRPGARPLAAAAPRSARQASRTRSSPISRLWARRSAHALRARGRVLFQARQAARSNWWRSSAPAIQRGAREPRTGLAGEHGLGEHAVEVVRDHAVVGQAERAGLLHKARLARVPARPRCARGRG